MKALLASVLAITVSFGRTDGQSGTIVYAAGATLDVEVPRGMEEAREVLEAMSRVSYQLHFTPTQSLMVWDGARGNGTPSPAGFRATKSTLDALALTLRRAWLAAEPNVLAKAYVEVGQSWGVKVLRSLSVDMYRVTAAVAPVEWRVTEQQGEHLGYRVARAVGEVGRDSVEAWFTPDIPVSGGPALYGGLPGMILVLSLGNGRTVYAATEVVLERVDSITSGMTRTVGCGSPCGLRKGTRCIGAHVYDADGVFLHEAEWPRGIASWHGGLSGDVALGVRKAEFDVGEVVRLRFRPQPAPDPPSEP